MYEKHAILGAILNTLKALVCEAWLSTVVQHQERSCVSKKLPRLTNLDTLSCSPKLAFKAALISRYDIPVLFHDFTVIVF